ncbi:hypothetical protein VTN96DRAFT_4243 [Rasamsonia emersonii]|uniref:FAD/FMN-containing dehydrogenase n=1 Tax=Rasamsonia emersonii (strain ATCC 16479 / CBS 393.64 / IMI 116815) TaxID=1408163 RepID=A0A0F4YPQ4_RASE3|nr:FAD/FMN-containing dehydrogenase [Rasamsonia emersonii CBS 393.64]KKA20090.1 FAD/FMN-containing dehydrogenase [Rasamsonia emersonii CBS 393.64]
MIALLVLPFCLLAAAAPPSNCLPCASIQKALQPLLSPGASVSCNTTVPRWSEYDQPTPGTVVTVSTEDDVAVAVQYAVKNNIDFLAQNGGNGWSTTLGNLNQCGLLINLRNLNQITFHAPDQATVQAGASISEVVDAAWANNARIYTGTCNCVGFLGAALGGGLGRTMGLYGLGVDQFISVNLVDASGQQITVTPQQADLWWALRGAGPNFGIVTSATVKAYPIAQAQNTAWTGPLFYNSSQIEAVVGAINNLTLAPEMQVDFYYTTSGAPDYTPAVIALPFYLGNETAGKAAFASLYAAGPEMDGTSTLPYNTWNAAGDSFCVKGGRKAAYGASTNNMDPTTWRAIWDEYTTFLQTPNTGNTSVLVECYSVEKAESIGATAPASYPFRNVKCHAIAIPWYADPSLDAAANVFGAKVRDLIRSSDGLAANSSYINFAHGDDPLQNVYGDSLEKLRALKAKYDPLNRFGYWFPLR